MAETVFPEWLESEVPPVHTYAYRGWVYNAFVSSAGDVAVITSSGYLISLKPQQFTVIDWHEQP